MSKLKWSIPSIEWRSTCSSVPQCMSCSENEIECQGDICDIGKIREISVDIPIPSCDKSVSYNRREGRIPVNTISITTTATP